MFTMKVSIFILRNLHFFLRPLPACYGNLSSWYQPWSWYQHLELLTEWRVSGKTVQKTVEKVKSYKRQESGKRKSYFKTVEGAKSYRRHASPPHRCHLSIGSAFSSIRWYCKLYISMLTLNIYVNLKKLC